MFYSCHRFIRGHQDLEFSICRWSHESYTFIVVWGEFTPTLEDMARLISCTVRDRNAIGVVLKGGTRQSCGMLSLLWLQLGYEATGTWLGHGYCLGRISNLESLVVEAKFAGEWRGLFVRGWGELESDRLGESLMAEVVGTPYSFLEDKEESYTNIAISLLINARDHF